MHAKPSKLILIAGPCALDSFEVAESVAAKLKALQARRGELDIYFKASFDKANRTSLGSPRGPGLAQGLSWLRDIRDAFGFRVVTDIHEAAQAEAAAEVCDVLQIPAFLCRQTDLLVAAAATGKCVNVKKGQFLSPFEMRFVVEKLEQSGASAIWQTERGVSFGYQNLIVDMRNFPILKSFGHPVIFDATHSTQIPGGDGESGGQRAFALPLARAALAAGADGLFVEAHPEPAKALSDGATQIPLDDLDDFIDSCLELRGAKP